MAGDLTVGLDMIAAATVPTKPSARLLWGVVAPAASPVRVVLENDASATPRPVSGNAAGPVAVGDRVLLARQKRRLTIVANPTAQVRMTADTGWVSSGVASAATGLSITSQALRRRAGVVWLDIACTATVAVTVPATGDIGNTFLTLQVAEGWRPDYSAAQALIGGVAGRTITGRVNSAGEIAITAVAGSANIAVGDTLRIGGSYVL